MSCVQQTCALEHQLNAVASRFFILDASEWQLGGSKGVKNQIRFFSFERSHRHVAGWSDGCLSHVQTATGDGEDAETNTSAQTSGDVSHWLV